MPERRGPAVCTIVAKNTLAQARALAGSLRRHHPELRLHALLADEVDGCFDPLAESFEVVPFAALTVPRDERLRFMHPQPALSYALTPWLIGWLLDRGHEQVLYLKQESFVVGDLTPLLACQGGAPIVLTPHLLSPPAGGAGIRRERDVLLAGVYNGGVLGISESSQARDFLDWWRQRLWRHCRLRLDEGTHYEQRWLDFVPVLFPGAVVNRDPGANIGHWCLPERSIEVRGDEVRVDGATARVFRFSGFELDRPEAFTRYGARLEATTIPGARLVLARYASALRAAGAAEVARWPSAWATYDDGVRIPDLAREIYRSLDDAAVERFGNPFAVEDPGSFRDWLDGSDETHPGLSRFWRSVYNGRPDLVRAFPDPSGSDRAAFLDWLERHGRSEYGVDGPVEVRRPR